MAIVSELCQWLHFIQGTFDMVDLIVLVIGSMIPLFFRSGPEKKTIARSCHAY